MLHSLWQLHKGILLLALAFLALVSAYIYTVPALEGFDAPAHFGYIGYLHEERTLPELTPETAVVSYQLVQQPPLYDLLAALATTNLPVSQAWEYADAMQNPYHGKGLSQRQTITPPHLPNDVLRTFRVARFISALGGLLAVVATWLFVRTLFPEQPNAALAAASVVAFNPLFLFISASITNDAWTTATAVTTLWLAARTLRPETSSPLAWLWVGLGAGLAGLVKYSSLLIAIPTLLLFLVYWRRVGWRRALRAAGMAALGTALVAGFWYVRNLLLYGQLVPMVQMSQAIPTLYRPEPLPGVAVRNYIPWLFTTYWGVFVSTFLPSSYYQIMRGLMLLSGVGLAVYVIRTRIQREDTPDAAGIRLLLTVCLIWFACVFASLLNWTRLIVSGEQGRLLLAAAPAMAVLLLFGWQALLPRTWQPRFQRIVPVLFLGIALFSASIVRAQYSLPPELDETVTYDRTIHATFVNGIQVLGVDFPAGAAVQAGETLPLTIYLRAAWPISEMNTAFLHLADADDHLLYQYDGVPVDGKHPTRQWEPGVIFADHYTVEVDDVPAETLTTLSLGFYNYEAADERVHLVGENGEPGPDRIVLGKIRVLPAASPAGNADVAAPSAPAAVWENGIELLRADVRRTDAGWPTAVEVHWRASRVIHQDYTIFVQLLDADDNIIAQVDQQPHGGRAPTSTWRANEILEDAYVLGPTGPQWQRLIVGMYDGSGERIPLTGSADAATYFTLLQKSPGEP
jgi:hypothetical protein